MKRISANTVDSLGNALFVGDFCIYHSSAFQHVARFENHVFEAVRILSPLSYDKLNVHLLEPYNKEWLPSTIITTTLVLPQTLTLVQNDLEVDAIKTRMNWHLWLEKYDDIWRQQFGIEGWTVMRDLSLTTDLEDSKHQGDIYDAI
jgi:hypothetical protein